MIYNIRFLDNNTRTVIKTDARIYTSIHTTIAPGDLEIEFNDESTEFDINELFEKNEKWEGSSPSMVRFIHGQTSKENIPVLERLIKFVEPIAHNARSIAMKLTMQLLIELGKDFPDAIWEVCSKYNGEVSYYE